MQERVLVFFQEISRPGLDLAAEIITMLGEQYFFILVMAFIYWNLSKKNGFKLMITFLLSTVLNGFLKIIFHAPRPFEKLGFIKGKRVETATGYAFPSGHTQSSTTFFSTLAIIFKKPWITFSALLLILLVGLSRIYLGVHWPIDVVGGIILGAGISLWLCPLVDRLYESPDQLKKFFFRIQGFVLLLTGLLFLIDLFFLKGSMKIEDLFKISGISSGAIYGFFWERGRTDFSSEKGGWIKKTLRYVLGLLGTVLLLSGLDLLFPEYILTDFIRYAITGLWITFLWPTLGTRLGLF